MRGVEREEESKGGRGVVERPGGGRGGGALYQEAIARVGTKREEEPESERVVVVRE